MRLPLLALLACPLPAFAKDLGGRVGVGFAAQLGDVAALSFRWGLPTGDPKVNIQLEADGGVEIDASGLTAMVVGGRLLYGVVAEDNLNLYLGAGGAYVQDASGGAVRVQPSMGAQFFFFGVENLGITAEWGVNIDVGTRVGVATVGGAPGVGVHYYF